jgi:hypothetical protein
LLSFRLSETRRTSSWPRRRRIAPSPELPYVTREVSDNEIQPESTPQGYQMTRYESSISSYSWPTVFEQPCDDKSALGKSLTEYVINKQHAGQGVTTSRRSLPKTVDHRLLKMSTSDAGPLQVPSSGPSPGGTSQRTTRSKSSPFDSFHSQARGYPTPPLWRTGSQLSNQKLPQPGPTWSEGGEDYSLRDRGNRPD